MYYTIRQPRDDTEEGALVCREDVAQVGPVEYVLERWENADPYWRAPSAGDEPGRGQVSPFPQEKGSCSATVQGATHSGVDTDGGKQQKRKGPHLQA